LSVFIFFFQAEDGIRDRNVTGVQTCALPIYKIEKDSSKSIMGEQKFTDIEVGEDTDKTQPFTTLRKIILIYFAICMTIYTIGVFQQDWGLEEMTALFLIIGIGTALLARMSGTKFVKEFVKGAQGMIYAALIVGLARSIVVVLENGMILDTVVNYISMILEPLPAVIGAV